MSVNGKYYAVVSGTLFLPDFGVSLLISQVDLCDIHLLGIYQSCTKNLPNEVNEGPKFTSHTNNFPNLNKTAWRKNTA